MRIRHNPSYKGYRTAGGFVLVRCDDLRPVHKLNFSAGMIYQAAASNDTIDAIVSTISAEVDVAAEQIQQDVEDCVAELLELDFLEEAR